MEIAEKKHQIKVVTIIGGIINILLSIIKVIIGSAFHSTALIVDGLHSFSDVITDVFVLWISKYSNDKPDKEHPYGHGRFETLGTVVIGSMLISMAMILAYENIVRLIIGDIYTKPQWPTFVGAILSIILKEWVFRFTLKVGEKVESKVVIANAWHSRSDAFSSIAVLFGLIFSFFGFPWMDTIMAIVVSIMIGKVGWDFLWSSIKELVDSALDPEFLEKIKAEILSVDGVINMHNLRSRKMGEKAILDVNIQVKPMLSASEGHEISTYVARNLINKFRAIDDVTVHTDVEDDRVDGKEYTGERRHLLPLRTEVTKAILELIPDFEAKILKINLHYRDRKILVDLIFNDDEINDTESNQIKEKLSTLSWLENTEIYLKK